MSSRFALIAGGTPALPAQIYFSKLSYASIRRGGGNYSAGFVTECTMIEPTPIIWETDAARQCSSSALRIARGGGF
jgi:hypothetical protein